MPVNPLIYVKAAAGLAFLLLAIWAFRVDSLRADHLSNIDAVIGEFHQAGLKGANRENVSAVAKTVVMQRNQARVERDQARTLVQVQSDSIKALSDETAEYIKNAEAQKRMIAETIRQRDIWIKRSREAATRTERMTAEQELQQCEDVLDSLYSQSF